MFDVMMFARPHHIDHEFFLAVGSEGAGFLVRSVYLSLMEAVGLWNLIPRM